MHDVCIIGSGFAGTYLGLRLAERGIKTVIVEAGGELNPGDSLDGETGLFPCETFGSSAFPVDFNRTIGIGGTSQKWNGVVSRFLPSDFKSQAEFGMFADWPISYDDLASYYDAAETALGMQPNNQCEIDASIFPLSLRADELNLVPVTFSGILESGPVRIQQSEIPRFRSMGSGTFVSHKPATRLITNQKGVITGVEVQGAGHAVEVVHARYVVVAAGVMETVRLLLTSTSHVFPDGIGNDRKLVGRYVHAHPRPRIHITRSAAQAKVAGVFRTYRYCDEFRRLGLASVCVDFNFIETEPAIDITIETEPAARNRIRLNPNIKDAWDRPIAVLEYESTALDQRTREHATALQRKLVAAMQSPGTGTREAAEKCFHPAGGCRMGCNESEGVVTGDGRVFGTENLYVAGASVFPTSGALNPTLTIAALAMRLGDHITARLKTHAS